MDTPRMPFKLLVLAPFAMNLQKPWNRPPLAVDPSNPDEAVESLGVSGYFPMPLELCPDGGISIHIGRFRDFHPDALIENHPFLRHLLAAEAVLSDQRLSASEKNKLLEQWPGLPDMTVRAELSDFEPGTRDADSEEAGPLNEILDMVAMPGEVAAQAVSSLAGDSRANGILQEVLSRIYSAAHFKKAEAAWLGLRLLLRQGVKANADFRLEIVPVTPETLQETLAQLEASQVDDLPSLVLVDLPFENTPYSINLLEHVARFAENLMAPAVAWASPGLLDLDSWTELDRLPFLPNYFQTQQFAKLNHVKSQPGAGWVAIACNRVLPRYPYGNENRPKSFPFEEPGRPWVSPAWVVSTLILKSLEETGWPTRFTSWDRFQIKDLAVPMTGSSPVMPSEILISEDRVDQLKRAGLLPVAAMADRDVAFVPMETTLGGVSLAFQLFASRVTRILLWCRENLPAELSGRALEDEIRQVFFLQTQGLQSIEIEAAPPDKEDRIRLKVTVHPSRDILLLREGLTLEFSW